MKNAQVLTGLFTLLLCVFAMSTASAQGVPPPNDSAPIDAAAILLVAGAAAYGYARLKEKEKEGEKE